MEDESSTRGHFKGHGAIFGNVDLGGDVIQAGAFANTLVEWKKDGMLPQLLWYHNNEEIIGEWTKMEEDEKGLYVEGKLWINGESRIERAVQAYNVIKSNSVKGLSIGYRAKEQDYQEQMDGSNIRILKELKLYEVSIAPWAMNPMASVTGVKTMIDTNGDILSKREVEKILRDSGLSKKQALAFVAKGYDGIKRDADLNDGDLLEILKSISKLSTTILKG